MSSSNMESLLGQAWEEYTKQREEVPPALNLLCEDLWHKIAQMEAPTPEEEDARLEICVDLTERLASLGSSLGGSLAAEPHGSFLMGCFTSSSPLEVAVTGKLPSASPSAGPNPNLHPMVDVELRSAGERLALLERVHSLVADCGVAAQGTVSINRVARVPSVSFEHASSGIPVRVCIAFPNFALRPRVVRGLALLEPRLRALIQLVELWADARGLNNPAAGTFNSWALVNLVIFSAQTFQPQPLLPPLWRVCGAPEPAAAAGAPGAAAPSGGATGGTSSTGGAAGSGSGGATGSVGGALLSVSSLLSGGSIGGGGGGGGGGGTSNGGATPMAVRPTQRLPGLSSSSEGLAPVLRDILARLTGPPEALGLPAGGGGGGQPAASSSSPSPCSSSGGLLPLFHWFLVLLDRLLAHWQLSWNRRWRVSTWWGQLVQQPFNRAFLVPVECPFDPADNAAKSLGCENQPKHQQVLRGVVAEVGASLRLLRATRNPEDLDRLVLGIFGLEVEHLYLEEEEEEQDEQEGQGMGDAGVDEQGEEGEEEEGEGEGPGEEQQAVLAEEETAGTQPADGAPADRGEPQEGGAEAQGVSPAAAAAPAPAPAAAQAAVAGDDGSGGGSSPTVPQVRLFPASEAPSSQPGTKPQRAGSPATAATGAPASPAAQGEGATRSGGGGKAGRSKSKAAAAVAAGQRSRASPAAGAPTAAAEGSSSPPAAAAAEGLGFDIEAVRVEKGADGAIVDDVSAANVGSGGSRRGRRRQAAAAAAESPPLPTSSAAAVTMMTSPAVLRANARVQQPLSPLLRDVTNARQYGNQQSGPEPPKPGPPGAAASTSAASSAAESPGGESLLPFEGLFGSLLEGARRLFDNMAQGMAELGEDLNELAATTAATIRAVINDDEDLPFLTSSSSSAAQRRQRRQRLQLLHRGGAPGGTAAGGGGGGGGGSAASADASPASTASASQQQQQQARQPRTPGSGAAAKQQQPRASPLGPGEQGVGGGGAATPGRRAAASPGLRSPGARAAAVAPGAATGAAQKQAARAAKRRGEEVAAALTAAASPQSAPRSPPPLAPPQQEQQPPCVAAATDASAPIPGSPKAEAAVAEMAPDAPLLTPVAVADADGTTAATAVASVPCADAGGDAAASNAAAAAAAGGPSIMLLSVPVGASDHPLACSPLATPPAPTAATAPPELAAAPPPPLPAVRAAEAAPGPAPSAAMPSVNAADAAAPGDGAAAAEPPPPLPLPQAASAAVPLAVGLLRLDSTAGSEGAARESLLSPTGTPGSATAAATSTSTAATTTTTTASPVLVSSSSVAAAAAAFAVPATAATTGVAAAAAAAAAAALLQDPASRTVLCLSSGRLQELAECIDRAGPCTTIDLQGASFAGPLAAPAMKVTAPGLWLINGELALAPEQQLVVVAKGVRMTDVTVRDLEPAAAAPAPPPPSAAAAAAPGGSTSGAAAAAAAGLRPALLVTKQSYVGGGELTLTRCQLLFGAGRSVGLQVKGKGCSAALERCQLRGSCQAAAQASDASLALTGCSLEGGTGHGLCCRDNAAVSAADCRIARFGGACGAALAGGSMELVGCVLSGEGASGPGVLAEGKGSSLVARGSSLAAFRAQAALVVTAGASVSLEDCRATDSGQGAVVGTRGGRLLAARCELSGHSSHGLAIGEGATADLRDCRLRDNGASGLRVGGVGSMAVLRGCELSGNAASGVDVAAGGCANLDGCTAAANGGGGGAGTDSAPEGWLQPQPQPPLEGGPAPAALAAPGAGAVRAGHGLQVEGGGARVIALRCGFSANAGSGVRVGPHGSAQLMGCGVHGNGRGAGGKAGGRCADGGDDGACGGSGGEGSRPQGGGSGVDVEVEAHGRATLSKGCSWGARGGAGVEGGGGRGVGGPQWGLRVAELGCLELQEGGD
ncbi:hypothetical protein PLESTM_000260700 [Pleodorina starrii]|nr:hypothetical protein PLESTM_000260700 [Pleodorina starrii]